MRNVHGALNDFIVADVEELNEALFHDESHFNINTCTISAGFSRFTCRMIGVALAVDTGEGHFICLVPVNGEVRAGCACSTDEVIGS